MNNTLLGLRTLRKLTSRYQIVSTDNLSVQKKLFSSYIPRRAVLYVPGSDTRKLNKIPSLNADCIVMDCEDGVALSNKDLARSTIRQVLTDQTIDFGVKDCSVRVNSVDSGLCEEDLREVLSAANMPQTLHLPKVDFIDHIKWFSDRLKKYSNPNLKDKFRLIIFTESAKSLLSLREICESCIQLSESSQFILDGIVFGSDDYCADIGATRTHEAKELLFARQFVVTVAKSFNLQAIDLVYINYKDLKGLEDQCVEGANFGFTGKQVIHPGQVDIVQTTFSPSQKMISWAQGLVQAFEIHQKEGKGAFEYGGSMIDMPLLLQARNILKMDTLIKK